MEQGDITEAHCNGCSGQRNHFILFHERKKWIEHFSDGSGDHISGEDRYDLLKCAGCGKVAFRHTNIFSENTDEEGRLVPTVTYYPPATFRREPKWLSGIDLSVGLDLSFVWLPEFITRLIREIYIAMHNDCRSLAVMGVRALLEGVMIDRVGDQGTFGKNIQSFEDRGFISRLQRESLESALDVGSASIHRSYNPSAKDLEHVLDIAESLIEAIYISNEQAAALKRRTPPRNK